MATFFFSSRRRHTRWTGDWSSDVCSSDLGVRQDERDRIAAPAQRVRQVPPRSEQQLAMPERTLDNPTNSAHARIDGRSEERRVGKEGRSRWLACHYNENGVYEYRCGVGRV